MTTNRTLLGLLDERLEESLCAVALSVMSVTVLIQVLARYVFYYPAAWTEEVTAYCMAWTVYVGAAYAIRERAHLRILNGARLMPAPVATTLLVAGDVLWFAFNVLMVWQGAMYVQSLWQFSHVSPALQIDQKWPRAVIPMAFGLMALRMVQTYYLWLRRGRRPF